MVENDVDDPLVLDLSSSSTGMAAAMPVPAEVAPAPLRPTDGSEAPRLEDLDAGFEALLEQPDRTS